jgi:hypothetical protein
MTIEQIIIAFLFAFTLGWVICDIWHKGRQFKIEINKETGEGRIVPINKPKQKVEFIGEPTRKEVEEAERPGMLHTFFSGFKKPAKKEEEEEEV